MIAYIVYNSYTYNKEAYLPQIIYRIILSDIPL